MRHFSIPSRNQHSALETAIQQKIDQKTKPVGALGQLERLALQICLIQQTLTPELTHPHIVVFAADHGITQEGVSLYPQEVTAQMVANFLAGGAAINVFARQQGMALQVVDAGVNADLSHHPNLIHQKIQPGTHNFRYQPAMSQTDCEKAIEAGSDLVRQIHQKGCTVIGFGEMGIGNTSSAALLTHLITKVNLQDCTGRGTGLADDQVTKKYHILQQALAHHTQSAAFNNPLALLATFGGFEIAQLCGAMLEAAANRMVILIDGFIATAALLVAQQLHPTVTDYCIYCHHSAERGHQAALNFLQAQPLLTLQLRLGEGTGCALAYPLVQAAVQFINHMASFESAGVSTQSAVSGQ